MNLPHSIIKVVIESSGESYSPLEKASHKMNRKQVTR